MLSAPGNRRAIRTALTESILRLCREHGLHSGQIDGIICIAGHHNNTIDDDNNDDELVIKVHETLASSVKRENGVTTDVVAKKEESTLSSLLSAQATEAAAASIIVDERFVSSPASPYHFPRRTVLKSERWSASAPSVGATECRTCDVVFAGFTQLSEHNEAVHGAFTCAGCCRTFTSRSNLERHARLHTGTRPYACTVCGRAFSRRDHLANHAARHALKCAACASRFPDRDMLAAHIARDHRATLAGVCARCNKGFASESAFDEHKKMHPAPPVTTALEHCDQCAFVCADRLTLAKHRLGHDGAARCYTCLACAGTFTDPLSYAAHLQTVHAADTDIFECCVCRQLCPTLNALHRHEMSHLQPPEGSASGMTSQGIVTAPPPPPPLPAPLEITPVEVLPEPVQDLSSSASKKHQCALCSLQFDCAEDLQAHAALLNHYEPETAMENGVEVVQPESPPPSAVGATYNSEFVVTNTPAFVIEVDDAESGGSAASSQIKMQPLHSMWPRNIGSRSHHRRKASPEKNVDASTAMATPMSLTADDSGGTGDGGSIDGGDGEGDMSMTPTRPTIDVPAGPHACSLCGQVESTFAQLESHCVLEHNRSPCVYCGKTFAQKANRDRHMCLHTGDRPYACPNCDERFARGDKLKNHRVRAHNIQYPALLGRRDAVQRKWKFKEWMPPPVSSPATPRPDWPTDSIHSTGEWQITSDAAQLMDEPMQDENDDTTTS